MLLANASESTLAAPILAISSTFAGNLMLIGSLSNLIVLGQAEKLGSRLPGPSTSASACRSG